MDPNSRDNTQPQRPATESDRGLNVPGREAAVQVLREGVNNAYDQNQGSNPYNRDHAEITDLQKYHTAWQQYYQQYYQRYYVQQAYEHRKQLALDNAAEAASKPFEPGEAVFGNNTKNARVDQLKADLLDKVGERAKHARASRHFVPIVSALVVGFIFIFLQYNRIWVANVKAYVSPGSVVNPNDTVLVDPTANANVGPEPRLIIPKINVDVPVVYDLTSLENGPVQDALTHGVVNYRLPGASSVPGQVGNTVILGHSSNDVFDPGGYKFAFVLLDKLDNGDLFYIHYQGKRYIYRVTDKKIITPKQLDVLQINTGKPIATLVTCTPNGTALKRLLVFADQISPDPTAAKPANSQASPSPTDIPGNSPTIFDRLLHLF